MKISLSSKFFLAMLAVYYLMVNKPPLWGG